MNNLSAEPLCHERDTQCGSYDCRWPQCKFVAPVHAPPAEPVAQQPEALMLADDLVRYWSRTTAQGERMMPASDGYWTPWHEAVVRIRELEAERDSWAQQADDRVTDAVQFCKERDEARSDLAASRERERAKDAALRAILAVSKRHQTATMNTISDCANIALAPDSAASPTGEAK